ncbi:hypothetical protein ACMGDH_09285 [Sphingomonas sp. DT-207]
MSRGKRLMLALAGLALIACAIGWYGTCLCSARQSSPEEQTQR